MVEERDKEAEESPPDNNEPTVDEAVDELEEAAIEGELEDKAKKKGICTVAFSGPLPPPELLEKYKEIQADFPERILRLTESEAEYRRDVTRQAIKLETREILIGQIFGLLVALATLGVVTFLGYFNQPIAASVLGVGGLTGLVTVFIVGRRRRGEADTDNEQRSNSVDRF